ncbi:hypothetical protein [Pedobacter boryungensis]|uniref:Lipocalin-like domain-containing protein n=1 Tax=Pedobacter boryungensis TaxID=869962 RepID=A0ABX2DB23_9SPHI|nr:hypothetical protein [Pedobacter boryungensis]NQX31243.1 hypothetical protein [Pedobacter boryungensis]
MKHCIYLLFVVLVFTGCKKEEKEDPLDILTGKTWKYSLVDKNPSTNGTSISVPFNVLADCEKDNTLQFKRDGNLIMYTGNAKCTLNESETRTLSFSYNKQTKELIIDGIKCEVLELTKNQLKYKAPVSYQTGYVYVMFILE